jgi:hypothetical protein
MLPALEQTGARDRVQQARLGLQCLAGDDEGAQLRLLHLDQERHARGTQHRQHQPAAVCAMVSIISTPGSRGWPEVAFEHRARVGDRAVGAHGPRLRIEARRSRSTIWKYSSRMPAQAALAATSLSMLAHRVAENEMLVRSKPFPRSRPASIARVAS